MKYPTLNYPNENLILKLFGFLYSIGMLLQLMWDRSFLLGTVPNFFNIYLLLCMSLLITPFLKTKFSTAWLITMALYFWLFWSLLKVQAGSDLKIGGSNFAMSFWVFLILGLQSWLKPSQTIFLLKFILLFSYFAGGVAKIRHGLEWINGWTLQYYFLQRHIDLDIPYGWWLFSDLARAKFLSVMIVTVELLTPLAFFNKRLEWMFVAFYFSFQLACYWLMKLKFMNYYGWSYMIYVSIALVYFYDRYKKGPSLGKEYGP